MSSAVSDPIDIRVILEQVRDVGKARIDAITAQHPAVAAQAEPAKVKLDATCERLTNAQFSLKREQEWG